MQASIEVYAICHMSYVMSCVVCHMSMLIWAREDLQNDCITVVTWLKFALGCGQTLPAGIIIRVEMSEPSRNARFNIRVGCGN